MVRSVDRYVARRSERRFAQEGDGQRRLLIAQGAARLIAEHGITDWAMAKRKAARALQLPESAALPGDDEVEQALADFHALFGGSEHAASLRRQRAEALRWMRGLAAFAPRLTGGVAAGWAATSTPIRLELEADNAKAVEVALIDANARYRAVSDSADGPLEYAVEGDVAPLHLVVRAGGARSRPRRERGRGEEARLTAAEVEALLAEP